MRLIGCHIENFGKFTDLDVAFQPGCNVFCRENGAGKSTLAAFIRVMLFGFDNERAKRLEDREREQFRPWQQGVYGGRLEFEAAGRAYVISRTFGQRDRDDTFDLREKETNLESHAFTDRVGEELFRLDRESFSRTVFISQNDCAAQTTDRINAKIGNLAENTDDINNYEAADKKLGDLLNRMSPTRATGSIRKLEREAADLRERVRAGSGIGSAMDDIMRHVRAQKKEQAGLRQEQAGLYKQQKTISHYKDIQADKKKYADLCQAVEDRTAAVHEARRYFPGQIPDGEELRRYLSESTGLSASEEKKRIYRLTEEEERELDRLSRKFAAGCPSEREIEAEREKLRMLHDVELETARNQMPAEDAEKLAKYRSQFGGNVPKAEEIEKSIASWQAREKKKKQSAVRKTGVLMVLAAVLAVAGIVCMAIENTVAGAGLIAAGVISTAAALAGVRMEKRREGSYDKETKFGDYGDLNQLYRLKAEAEEYCRLRLREETVRKMNLTERKNRLETELQAFCGQFDPAFFGTERMDAVLRQLEEDLREYRRLNEKMDQYAAACRHDLELRGRLCGYLEGLSMLPDENLNGQFADVRNHLQAYQATLGEQERARSEQADFEKNHDIEKFLDFDSSRLEHLPSLESLGDRLEAISNRLAEIERNLTDYNRQMDDLQERQNQVAEDEQTFSNLREKIAADRRKYELFQKTREFLAKARESFTARYTGPLLESFGKYYRILAREEARQYHLDANIRLTVDEKGQQRQVRSFSTGYQDLIGICMRMALIDAMYREEKPFVIFDDPFVNLDREKVAGGLEFLDVIGNEYQILYFTCHESRAGK